MVIHMTDEHVDQGPGTNRVSAGSAKTVHGLIRHILDSEYVGAA